MFSRPMCSEASDNIGPKPPNTDRDRPQSATHPVSAAEVNRQFVLTKCDFFLEVQLWPLHNKLDPERWLSNFTTLEMNHAVHLLHAFMYFSQLLMDQMFSAAFQKISQAVRRANEPFLSTQAAWRSFVDNAIITHVTGETPRETDSGFHFSRMGRQVLDIHENRILSPEGTLEELLDGGPRPVVFVDDFVGSGNQFVATWKRVVQLKGSIPMSFENLASVVRGSEFIYCPLVCTDLGRQEISRQCPGVRLKPVHFLSRKYSALAPDSFIWPDNLRDSAVAFLGAASKRAGIPDYEWKGFNELGLAIAFENSVPDATLPLFYWNENGWKPLVERK